MTLEQKLFYVFIVILAVVAIEFHNRGEAYRVALVELQAENDIQAQDIATLKTGLLYPALIAERIEKNKWRKPQGD